MEGAARCGSAPRPASARSRPISASDRSHAAQAGATRDEVVKLCEEARQHRFASVCVNTTWVPLCKALLAGRPT